MLLFFCFVYFYLMNQRQLLLEAEAKAEQLFQKAVDRHFFQPGKTEKEISDAVFKLAYDLFGIEKYWHKRLVRVGENTLLPYHHNPPMQTLKEDDILFLDFGPIFEEWEADFGRTYVIGNDPKKLKLQKDIMDGWDEVKTFFNQHEKITGAELYAKACKVTNEKGWEFGGEIAGHIIGHFPHEKLEKEVKDNYIHPDNHQDMHEPDKSGNARDWILEIHFIDQAEKIGGFTEQLLT